jgi:hypothetical protein
LLKAFQALAAARVTLSLPQMNLTWVPQFLGNVEQKITDDDTRMNEFLVYMTKFWTTLNVCLLTRDAAERVLKTFDDKLSILNIDSSSNENHARVSRLKMLFSATVNILPHKQSSNCDNNREKQSLEAQVNRTLKK